MVRILSRIINLSRFRILLERMVKKIICLCSRRSILCTCVLLCEKHSTVQLGLKTYFSSALCWPPKLRITGTVPDCSFDRLDITHANHDQVIAIFLRSLCNIDWQRLKWRTKSFGVTAQTFKVAKFYEGVEYSSLHRTSNCKPVEMSAFWNRN